MTQATACPPATTRHKPCEICGTDFPRATPRQKTCVDPDCKRALKNLRSKNWYHKQRATGWAREKTQYSHTCTWCEIKFESDSSRQIYCGLTCSNLARISREERAERAEAEHVAARQKQYRALATAIRKAHRVQQRQANIAAAITVQSRALAGPYREGNYHEFINRLRRYWIIEQSNGCWNSKRLRDGYPFFPCGDRDQIALHRTIIELREGSPLGEQAAHHKCGNSKCVNPDHLQPVTQAENAAEMLARNAYLKKIQELTVELRKHDPDNAALRFDLMNMRLDA